MRTNLPTLRRTPYALIALLVLLVALLGACTQATPEEDDADATIPAAATDTAEPATEEPAPTDEPTATTPPTETAPAETPQSSNPTAGGAPTRDDLANATYEGIYDEPVTLTDGEYEGEPFQEDSASRPTVMLLDKAAFGDLDGDGVADAATVLAEHSGGSGTFIYLAAMVSEDGALRNVATQLLGDRVVVDSIIITDGEILLEGVTHGPDDPLCCPSQSLATTFALEGDRLVETSSVGGGAPAEPTLVGPVWRWLGTQTPVGDLREPENPDDYTIQFMEDGTVAIQADCNSVLGTYTTGDEGFSITLGPSTLVACPEGSLGDAFLADLSAAVIPFFQDGDLYIDLMMDSGTMHFDALSTELPGSSWRVTSYNNGREAVVGVISGSELTTTFGEDGTISGASGCNTFRGGFEVDGDAISVGPLATTRMACAEPEGVMDQEQEFLAALEQASTYQFVGTRMEIRGAEGELLVSYERLPAEPTLVGPVWRWLGTQTPVEMREPENPDDYTLQFMEDGTVAIQADCNSVLGTYTTGDEGFSITLGPSTLAACPEGSLGDAFIADLSAAVIPFFQDGDLYLDMMMDSGTMHFDALSTELPGTSWRVTGYNNGREAVVGVISGSELTTTFGDDGTISGAGGCNTYRGSLDVDGDAISVGPLATTLMACAEPEGVMDQEQEFLAALEQASTYQFVGTRLELRGAEGELLVSYEPLPDAGA